MLLLVYRVEKIKPPKAKAKNIYQPPILNDLRV
jgi:hypothetical protein